MWILNFIPDSLVHLLLVLSILGTIAGFVLGFIPFVDKYKLPIQIISVLILAVSVYIEGGISEAAEWKQKMAALEVKLAESEAAAAKINTTIVTKVLTKRQVVKEKGEDVIKFIDREVVKYDATCPIPTAVISAHNAAALGKTVDEMIETNTHNNAAIKLPKRTK